MDAVAAYYRPGIGTVLRQRLRWILRALPRGGRVLEIGYGSGIFLPTLDHIARQVVGIDIHPHAPAVRRALAAQGTAPALVRASATELPFRSEAFDAVVIAAVLEFVSSPDAALQEAVRVLRPGGRLVGVSPRTVAWADRTYRLLAGFDPERDFAGRRQGVHAAFAALRQAGVPIALHGRPGWLPHRLAPYDLFILDRP